MLETSHERVKLLKERIDGKTIEKLYIRYNDFRIVNLPALFDVVEIPSCRWSGEECERKQNLNTNTNIQST